MHKAATFVALQSCLAHSRSRVPTNGVTGMPIYIEISRLHRVVTMVARGKISADDIREAAQELVEAHAPQFAKSSMYRP